MTAIVQVTVDPERCMGSGTCLAVAPGLFEIGSNGTAEPVHPLAEPTETLEMAMSRCPTAAIRINRA